MAASPHLRQYVILVDSLAPALFGSLGLRSSSICLQHAPLRSLYNRDEYSRRVWQQALTVVDTSFGWEAWCPPSFVLCPYKNTLHIHRLFDSDLYVIETECSGMFGTKVGCPRRHVVLVGTNPVRFSWSCITLCTSTACYTRISML